MSLAPFTWYATTCPHVFSKVDSTGKRSFLQEDHAFIGQNRYPWIDKHGNPFQIPQSKLQTHCPTDSLIFRMLISCTVTWFTFTGRHHLPHPDQKDHIFNIANELISPQQAHEMLSRLKKRFDEGWVTERMNVVGECDCGVCDGEVGGVVEAEHNMIVEHVEEFLRLAKEALGETKARHEPGQGVTKMQGTLVEEVDADDGYWKDGLYSDKPDDEEEEGTASEGGEDGDDGENDQVASDEEDEEQEEGESDAYDEDDQAEDEDYEDESGIDHNQEQEDGESEQVGDECSEMSDDSISEPETSIIQGENEPLQLSKEDMRLIMDTDWSVLPEDLFVFDMVNTFLLI